MFLSQYLNQNTLMQASFHTAQNYGACYLCRLVGRDAETGVHYGGTAP